MDRALSRIAVSVAVVARRSHYVRAPGRRTAPHDSTSGSSAGEETCGSSSETCDTCSRAPRQRSASAGRVLPRSGRAETPCIERRQRAVTELYGETDDREMLLAMMRVARTIPTAAITPAFFGALAPRYLAIRTATSGCLLRRRAQVHRLRQLALLEGALLMRSRSPEVTRAIIDLRDRAVVGDGRRILISLVRSGQCRARRSASVLRGGRRIFPSEGNRSRVLLAASR